MIITSHWIDFPFPHFFQYGSDLICSIYMLSFVEPLIGLWLYISFIYYLLIFYSIYSHTAPAYWFPITSLINVKVQMRHVKFNSKLHFLDINEAKIFFWCLESYEFKLLLVLVFFCLVDVNELCSLQNVCYLHASFLLIRVLYVISNVRFFGFFFFFL